MSRFQAVPAAGVDAELRQRGFITIEEPGRRIVDEELRRGGTALPWVDAVAFARRAIEVSVDDRAIADTSAPWVFFDRGLIEAATALEHLTGEPVVKNLGSAHRYNKRVFLVPPWPEMERSALDHFRVWNIEVLGMDGGYYRVELSGTALRISEAEVAGDFLSVGFSSSRFAVQHEAVSPWNCTYLVFSHEVPGTLLGDDLFLNYPIGVTDASKDFVS